MNSSIYLHLLILICIFCMCIMTSCNENDCVWSYLGDIRQLLLSPPSVPFITSACTKQYLATPLCALGRCELLQHYFKCAHSCAHKWQYLLFTVRAFRFPLL